MSGRALVTGSISRTDRRTAKTGKPFLLVGLRQAGATADRKVYVFNTGVAEEIESLAMETRVAFAGRIWTPQVGEPCLVADSVLQAYSKKD